MVVATVSILQPLRPTGIISRGGGGVFLYKEETSATPSVAAALKPLRLLHGHGHTWPHNILHRWHVHPGQHNDRSARPPAATSWWQGCESSSATRHSQWPALKRGTACQSTSGHLKLSLHSRVAWRHICLNSHTARSDDSSDIVRRPSSDSHHVTAPYKLTFYYYY